MSNIVKFCLSLGLLSTFVHANIESLKTKLNQMAKSEPPQLVAQRFLPYKNEFIDLGADGFICNGERYYDEKKVALKFIKSEKAAEREFEMYSYLKAMEKPETLEKFGLANVYYYAKWEEYYLLVLSYFVDGYLTAKKKYLKKNVCDETINGLLVFRHFVRQSKYMHSCGIRHDNISPQNIMLQKSQMFLINFNCGSKMLEHNHLGTPKYAARAFHKNYKRTALSDWESFLFSMCDLYDIELPWFSKDISNDGIYFEYKNMKKTMLTQIRQSIMAIHLRKVFVEFFIEIFDKEHKVPYPNYDRFEELINDQIKNLATSYEMFSWIGREQKFLESEKKRSEPIFDIKIIPNPKSIDFSKYKYPVVNTEHSTKITFGRSLSEILRTWTALSQNKRSKL